MAKFAANLSLMFGEAPFLGRFRRAARAGFKAVEFQFPYAWVAGDIRRRLDDNGLELVLFNAPPGDWEAGERGIAALPGREKDFHDALQRALDYAGILGGRRLHVMAGLVPDERRRTHCRATFLGNLDKACRACAAQGIDVMIEPLNRRDVPGYLIADTWTALDIIRDLRAPNLYLQYDVYHAQINEGDLTATLGQVIDLVGHVQIAGVPGRNEPDGGEVNFPAIFRLLDQLGYAGWIGCEYRPAGDTLAGLGWARAFLDPPALLPEEGIGEGEEDYLDGA